MPVIALTQEMGSLAQDIAEQLARQLNLTTLKHEVATHVANKMRVTKSLVKRLREGNAGPIERLRADRSSVEVFAAEDVLDAASAGNVVLRGWGSTCLLRPVPHVVCVRVTRSMRNRISWLMNHLDMDDAETAEKEIIRSDRAHAARMHDQFGVTWGDPLLYDLVLNTDRLTVETCVRQISDLVNSPEFAETEASHALLQDMALEARVRSTLRGNDGTHAVDVVSEARNGHLTLKGIVFSDHEKAAVENIAAGVAGVGSVENRLRVVRTSPRFTYVKN